MKKQTKYVNILWTGGWDSTSRMIQASREACTIQPYYIIDPDRPSSLKEIRQMQKIKNALKIKSPTSNIKDIKNLVLDTLVIENKYKLAHKNLLKQCFLGSQYIWFGKLSKQIENLELCVHSVDKIGSLIRLMYSERNSGNYNKESDLELLFGSMKFPLMGYTKLKMEEECIKNNDLDILNMSWFCFTPINGTPCGLCNPCKYALEEGMLKRFSKRGVLYSKFPILFRGLRKLAKRFF